VSAYTVSKVVIDALMTAALRWSEETPGGLGYYWFGGGRRVESAAATPIGQMLWYTNWYHADGWFKDAEWFDSEVDEVPDEPVYEYDPLPGDPAPLVVLRLIDNYVYQTGGEPEDWRPTEAFGFVDMLRRVAIGKLPGYADLPWCFAEDDRDIFQRDAGDRR
jgi:hypothetical protein